MDTTTGRQIGRPRGFDADLALDRAVEVFWNQGYEGASLSDLTSAMGITRTSMYAAFGNKRDLYTQALARYAERDLAYAYQALRAPTARQVAEMYLRSCADAVTTPGRPPGCFTVQSGLACSPENSDVTEAVARARAAGEQAMLDRFRRAVDDGDLTADDGPDELARYLMVVGEGLAVHAATGATREDLQRVVEVALRTMPDRTSRPTTGGISSQHSHPGGPERSGTAVGTHPSERDAAATRQSDET